MAGAALSPACSCALEALHAELANATAALDVACRACGACCRFEEVEHVLYASAAERRLVLDAVRDGRVVPLEDAPAARCPFQDGTHCRAHAVRPVGCRLHFCRNAEGGPLSADVRASLEALSAEAHRRLAAIHEASGTPWAYRPFVAAMRAELPVVRK